MVVQCKEQGARGGSSAAPFPPLGSPLASVLLRPPKLTSVLQPPIYLPTVLICCCESPNPSLPGFVEACEKHGKEGKDLTLT